MAPHFKLSPEEYETWLKNLKYTPYEQAAEFLGQNGHAASCTTCSNTVMEAEPRNGAARGEARFNQQIDNRSSPTCSRHTR